jgi:crossover junction endodeoxyribonuclease RuvC
VATGYGVLERGGAAPLVLATGVITTTTELALEARIHLIYDGVHDVLLKHGPDMLVLEDLYAEYKFPRTALLMAHARGAVCLAAAQCGVPVMALAPAEVKRAVAFNGAAGKAQVQHAIGRLLTLAEPPHPSHVADALALAWTGLSRAGGPGSVGNPMKQDIARGTADRAKRGTGAGARSSEARPPSGRAQPGSPRVQ